MTRKALTIPDNPVYLLKATLSDYQGRLRGRPYRVLAVIPSTPLFDLAYTITNAFEFDFDHAFGFFDNLKNPYQAQERYELFVDLEQAENQAAELPHLGTKDAESVDLAIVNAFGKLDISSMEARLIAALQAILQDELLTHIPADLQSQAKQRLPIFFEELVADLFLEIDEDFLAPPGSAWETPAGRGVQHVPLTEAFDYIGKKMLFLFDYGDEWRFIVEFKRAEVADPKATYPRLVESSGKAPEQYPDYDDLDEADEA